MGDCNRVVLRAPAKVNLALDIVGLLENGYHLLDSVMQTVNLYDILLIGRQPDGTVRVTCSQPDVPVDETNTAYRAAMAFFAATGLPVSGLHIHIDKAIPEMAGLGGGSADAAAVLCGLNHLFGTALSAERLCEIGLEVGADVPFCIHGGTAFVQGIGEVITPLPALPLCRLLIAKPAVGMSTVRAFALYDEGHIDGGSSARKAAQAVAAGDLHCLGACFFNVFEQVEAWEAIDQIKAAMLQEGALGAVLSGSGSAITGLFMNEADAKRCVPHLQLLAEQVFVATPVQHGAHVVYREK